MNSTKTTPEIADRLTQRELDEFLDHCVLEGLDAHQPASFESWLDSEWGDHTARQWLNANTTRAIHGVLGSLDAEKIVGRDLF